MREKKLKFGLLPRIIIAIILGIVAGYVFPDWLGRIFVTFNATFSQFLSFCIPLIIIGFVTMAIGEIGSKSGKMLLFTAVLAYVVAIFEPGGPFPLYGAVTIVAESPSSSCNRYIFKRAGTAFRAKQSLPAQAP